MGARKKSQSKNQSIIFKSHIVQAWILPPLVFNQKRDGQEWRLPFTSHLRGSDKPTGNDLNMGDHSFAEKNRWESSLKPRGLHSKAVGELPK